MLCSEFTLFKAISHSGGGGGDHNTTTNNLFQTNFSELQDKETTFYCVTYKDFKSFSYQVTQPTNK